VDLDEEWFIPDSMPFSKAGWTQFSGRKVNGRVRRVVLRGEVAFVDGEVLVNAGYGQNIFKGSKTVSDPQILANEEQSQNELRKINELYSEMFKELGMQDQTHSTQKPLSVIISSPSTSVKQILASPAPVPAVVTLQRGLMGKHIISVDNFNHEQLHELFNLAHKFRICVAKDKPLDRGTEQIPLENILKGKIMALMFYEVSTRTCCSFAAAMQRLGGGVIYMNEETSSVKKGETLADSVTMMASYSDLVVLRHPSKGAVANAAQTCLKPLINAGDGAGEHPTQALLDIFTIREEIGTVNNLVVSFLKKIAALI
jgi:carbamoyl-phosphate synthase / aspartate carbamoyltransferase / dihydroorotase